MITAQTVIGIFLILLSATTAYLFYKVLCHELDIKGLRQTIHDERMKELKNGRR